MNLWPKIKALITRGVVSGSSADGPATAQVEWLSDRASDGVEIMQPQGVHFLPPIGAEGVTLCPAAQSSGRVLVCASARATVPGDGLAPGEGGLYYAGDWKVFLDADGNVHLGERDASDYVALASRVDTLFQNLALALQVFSTLPAATPITAGILAGAVASWVAEGTLADVGSSTVQVSE